MSEANTPNGAEATAGGPPVVINAQYIKDLSFENPNAPGSLVQQSAPQIELRVNVGARALTDALYEVQLSVNGTAKHEEETAFIVELSYGAVVTLNNVPEEHIQAVLLIEVPRLLFPFARAIVSDVVRDGGFPPLMLQPIDFVDLYQRQFANQQGQTADA
jgi:preprotein translocase subunit SecB